MKDKKKYEKEIFKILIAEDSPTQAEQLKHILENNNYKVIVAKNGKEALKLSHEYKPSLIISDIVMPEMNGYELCKKIKTDEITMDIPVILLTSLSNSEDVLEGISCRADNFITKPYNENYLISHIEHILSNREISKKDIIRIGVEIVIGGEKRFISAGQQQMLGLLISTYEAAVQRNNELMKTQDELRSLTEHLEELVEKRTTELSAEIEIRKKAEEGIKKINRVYAVLSNINQVIIRVHDTNQLFKDACTIAVNDGKFQSAWIRIINDESNIIETKANAGLSNDYFKNGVKSMADKNPITKVIKSGKCLISNNINADANIPLIWKKNASSLGFNSLAIFPLKVFQKVIGSFCIYSNEINFFDDQETSLLSEIAMDISFAVEVIKNDLERNKIEEKLSKSNERFNRIVSSLNDVVWTASLDGAEIIEVNDSFENIYGINKDVFKANPKLWIEMVHPDDRSIAEASNNQLCETGSSEVEYRIIKPDGSVVWLLDRKSLIYDETGKAILMGGIAKDITQRKLAEEAIISSEFRYRRLFESAKDGILILDAKTGKIVDVNPFMMKMLGYSRDVFIEKTIWEIGFFKDTIMNQNKFLELQRNEYVRYEDLPLETADGRIIDVEFISNVYLVNNQKVVQCNIRNISERKAAENLIITQRDLGIKINSIAKHDELYNISIDALYNVTGMECGSIYLFDTRKQCLDLVYSKGLTDKYISVLSHFDADSDIVKLVKTGKPIYTDFNELPITHKAIKHDKKLANVFILPLVYKKKVIGSINLATYKKNTLSIYLQKGLEAIAILISNAYARIQNEDQIRNMNAELEIKVEERTAQLGLKNEELSIAKAEAERANIAKSEFLSRMSHELRTPLNSILGFAQLMNMGEITSTQNKLVNHILKSGKHLLDLINEVLDISRIEAGKLSLSLEHVQLKEIIFETMDIITPLAIERNVTLEFPNSEFTNLCVKADRQKMKQVLLNLVNNAAKYNRVDGKVKIECRIMPLVKGKKQMIRVSVIDTGKGIKPEEMHKLFNPFQRIGSDISEVEGTGLGLAVAKKLVDAMSGNIGVESKVGVGSTFWIELQQVENNKDKQQELKDVPIHENVKAGVIGSILYIEDNASNIKLVEQIIEMQRPSIRLIIEMYGKNAVKRAIDYKPYLILLDLDLPDIHGSEVLKLLQANEITKSIPVVILSADAMSAQIEKLLKAGVKDYLTKPIDIVEFLRIVDNF
ncbi:MAG: response regulator [Bacteroidetes bacterium]|nr:response regulator [Bacteroidota bacterium]MBU1114404.1 response regulator [Bacteroidota bacterium]MBU1797205.1 response regulator [Bacteroidota bacterium]